MSFVSRMPWWALRAHSDNHTLIAENYSGSSGIYIRQTKLPDLNDKVRVCKAEEKRTDANIATNMLMDAVDGKSEHFDRRVFTLDKAIAKRDIPFKMCRPIACGTCDREYIARVQTLAQDIASAQFLEAGKT